MSALVEEVLDRVCEQMRSSWCREEVAVGGVDGDGEMMLLLWIGDVLSAAVVVRVTPKLSCITMADSTGFKRGHSKEFVMSVVRSLPGFIMCFSQPMDELIFGRSSENGLKSILEPAALFRFWKSCFAQRCSECADLSKRCASKPSLKSLDELNSTRCYFSTWSNFDSARSFPYKHLGDIVKLKDDPKTKMMRKFRRVEDLFDGLLHRKDFIRGGVLYSNCTCTGRKTELDEAVGSARVREIVEFLRASNFSNESEALRLSTEIRDRFSIVRRALVPDGSGLGVSVECGEVKLVKPRRVT